MKFTKPSLSIADQIARIEKRGMAVPDHALAAHRLQHISYYRLRAYWLPFEDVAPADGEHKFKPGTCFDDVLALYVFDRRLRLLVMDAVERVEVSLRGTWAHHLAMKYGPHGYLDPTLYGRTDRYALAFAKLIEDLDRSKDTFITHYKSKYDDPVHPPVWMTAEIISLGQLSMWFSNLKHRADRQAIAKLYSLDETLLVSLAHHLTYVRNICAHHGRLWNKQITVKMTIPKAPASLKLAMNHAVRGRVYNTLSVLGYLMGIVAPSTQWRRSLVELMDSCPLADPAAMGFPNNWKSLPAWKPFAPSEPATS
jgi:abortive infection bacteriophage resistance protein